MLFLALCFFENQSSFALYSASLEPKLSCAVLCFSENQSSLCAALCFSEKPKLSLRCALL